MKIRHYVAIAIFWLMSLGAVALLMNGCKEEQCYSVIEDEVDKLCSKYDLYICGDIDKPPYSVTTYEEIREYLSSNNYRYVSDTCPESYEYMAGDVKRGDCEDYVITVMEDLLMLGYISNARWMYGKYDEHIYHAWLLVNIGSVTYVFDSYYPLGRPYVEIKYMYNEMKVVMEK